MVYDYVFRGISQPTLGSFSIPLGEILKEEQRKHEKGRKQSVAVIKALDAKLRGDGPMQNRPKEE